MARRSTKSLFALLSLLPLAACSLPGGGSGGPPGGFVSVSTWAYEGGSYSSASAFFIARLDTSNGSVLSAYGDSWVPELAKGACEIVAPPGEATPVPSPVGLDVGSTVVIATGVTSEEITLDATGTEGQYSSSVTPTPGLGKPQTITIEGNEEISATTWEEALHLPSELAIDGFTSTLLVSSSDPTEITWSTIGADSIVLTFPATGGSGICHLEDDGTFEIPAEFAAEIDPSGYFTILGIADSKKTLSGRSVRLIGASGQQGYYTVGSGSPALN